ncbi:hypothetical protein Tco_0733979 [Tanacetum coccineum]
MEARKLFDHSIDLSHGHNVLISGSASAGLPQIRELSSLRSIGGGMYRDGGSGGSGGSGGDDDGSNGDGICSGYECAGGVMLLTRRSPAEGGDSEIGGDGDGVVMARSLSTSTSGGGDMKA